MIASVSAIFFRLSKRVGPSTVAAAAKVKNLPKYILISTGRGGFCVYRPSMDGSNILGSVEVGFVGGKHCEHSAHDGDRLMVIVGYD